MAGFRPTTTSATAPRLVRSAQPLHRRGHHRMPQGKRHTAADVVRLLQEDRPLGCPVVSTSTWCSTTSRRTWRRWWRTDSPTPSELAGTFTSPLQAPAGSTWLNAGSPSSPNATTAEACSQASATSSTPSRAGPPTGTTTPSPSAGTRPATRSSSRCGADVPPSTRSNARRITSVRAGTRRPETRTTFSTAVLLPTTVMAHSLCTRRSQRCRL
jgi:hypothetical protein